MVNRNYISGRDLEYDVINFYRSCGYTCVRAAGSHSPFDVVVIEPTFVRLIQCKVYKKSKPKPDKEFVDFKVPKGCIKIWATKKKGTRGFVDEIIE